MHIVAAHRQVADSFPVTVLVKSNDLNQTVNGNCSTVGGCQFLRSVKPKGNIKDFPVIAHAIGFVHLKALDEVDFHFLSLIVEARGSFCDRNLLTCVHKLHGMRFPVQHHSIRGFGFPDFVSAKIQFLALCCTVRTRGNRVHDFAFRSPECPVQSIDVLGCGNLIDSSLKPTGGKDWLIQPLIA